MGYDVSRRVAKQWSLQMVDEEAEVWTALKEAGYKFLGFSRDGEPDSPRLRDFTAIPDMYEVYLRYHRGHEDPPLTVQQFGVAFNAVTENSLIKSRRWVDVGGKKKKLWGYRGVRGPKSHIIHTRKGRPPID
jgi:hypothetical protein